MRIVIQIESLVLHGLERLDQEQFQAAVRQHVLDHIQANGVPAGWGASGVTPTITAVYRPASADAAGIGQQVGTLLVGEGRA